MPHMSTRPCEPPYHFGTCMTCKALASTGRHIGHSASDIDEAIATTEKTFRLSVQTNGAHLGAVPCQQGFIAIAAALAHEVRSMRDEHLRLLNYQEPPPPAPRPLEVARPWLERLASMTDDDIAEAVYIDGEGPEDQEAIRARLEAERAGARLLLGKEATAEWFTPKSVIQEASKIMDDAPKIEMLME